MKTLINMKQNSQRDRALSVRKWYKYISIQMIIRNKMCLDLQNIFKFHA